MAFQFKLKRSNLYATYNYNYINHFCFKIINTISKSERQQQKTKKQSNLNKKDDIKTQTIQPKNITQKAATTTNKNNYQPKSLMTEYEQYFYKILVELEDELNIKIQPQVNLATILKKENNNKYINELFRNIDFGIFSKDYSKLLLLIEINDKTHKNTERKQRDKKVKEILDNANVKLIKFYSNYPNKKEYVKNRIKKELIMILNNNL